MKKFSVSAAIIVLMSAPSVFCAVKIHPDAGTTSAAFLKIGAGARASSMAGAFSSVADDATAIYWNPAGLMFVPRKEIAAAHNESFEGIRHDYLGFAGGNLSGKYRWGAAFYGLYTPSDIERRSGTSEDDPFEPVSVAEGYFAAYDAALSFAAARGFGQRISVGAAAKLINQTIDDRAGWGAAVDAGIRYEYSDGVSLAAVIRNIGTPIAVGGKSYPLPISLRLGADYSADLRSAGRLRGVFETSLPTDNYPSFHFGAEYFPVESFAFRAGYRWRLYGPELDDLSGLAVGAGMKIGSSSGDLKLDYSFNPYGVLGNSHRITLSVSFGNSLMDAQTSAPRGLAEPSDAAGSVYSPTRREVVLPSENPAASSASEPPVSEFAETPAVFTPGIVSPSAVTGVISAEPGRDGIKSFKAILRTRGSPPSHIKKFVLRTAARRSPDGSSSDYFFRVSAGGSVSDAVVALDTSRKIKSVESLPATSIGSASSAPSPLPQAVPFSLRDESSVMPPVMSYEIKSGSLRDIRVTYE
ncbi:MAG: PorV/PorQ family protein [Endomicrobiia bacterium]|nr:PorV/PorQ family protein [Endomicrobiia bacterium]